MRLGDWNGGFALYVSGFRLTFAFRPAGELASTSADQPLMAGDHVLSAACQPQADSVEFVLGSDGQDIGRSMKSMAMPLAFQHGGARLRIGEDHGFPVVNLYEPPFSWSGTYGMWLLWSWDHLRCHDPWTSPTRCG